MATTVSKTLNTDLLLLSIINNRHSFSALLKKGYTYIQIINMISSLEEKDIIKIDKNNEYILTEKGKNILKQGHKNFFIEPDTQYILNTEINDFYIPSRYTVKELKR